MFQVRRDRGFTTHDIRAAVMTVRCECDIAGSQADVLEALMLTMLADRPSQGLKVEVMS